MIGLTSRISGMLGTTMLVFAMVFTTACSRAEGTGQGETLGMPGASSQSSPEILVYKSPT